MLKKTPSGFLSLSKINSTFLSLNILTSAKKKDFQLVSFTLQGYREKWQLSEDFFRSPFFLSVYLSNPDFAHISVRTVLPALATLLLCLLLSIAPFHTDFWFFLLIVLGSSIELFPIQPYTLVSPSLQTFLSVSPCLRVLFQSALLFSSVDRLLISMSSRLCPLDPFLLFFFFFWFFWVFFFSSLRLLASFPKCKPTLSLFFTLSLFYFSRLFFVTLHHSLHNVLSRSLFLCNPVRFYGIYGLCSFVKIKLLLTGVCFWMLPNNNVNVSKQFSRAYAAPLLPSFPGLPSKTLMIHF